MCAGFSSLGLQLLSHGPECAENNVNMRQTLPSWRQEEASNDTTGQRITESIFSRWGSIIGDRDKGEEGIRGAAQQAEQSLIVSFSFE